MSNDWLLVTSASSSTIALKKDGTLWSSGNNWHGATGQGTRQGTTVQLTQIGTDNDWIDVRVHSSISIIKGIRVENDWTLAIKSDGSLWAWGSGGEPWTGFINGNPILVPTMIQPAGNKWKRILPSNNEYYALLQKNDGSIWETPISRIGEDKWIWAEVGADLKRSFIGIKLDGSLWGGSVENGFTLLDDTSIWLDASLELSRNSLRLAIKNDGTLWYSGGLTNFRGSTDLTQLGSDTDWVKVRATAQSVVAMKEDGSLWGWGVNYENRFGILNEKDLLISEPEALTSLGSVWGNYDLSPLNIVLYDDPPLTTLIDVNPKVGLESGGETVSLYVKDFDATTPISISFGGIEATNIVIVNDIQIDCTAPAVTGTVDVTLTQGSNVTSVESVFEYVTELSPEPPEPPPPSSRVVTVSFQHHYYGSDLGDVSLMAIDGNGNMIGSPAWTYNDVSELGWKPVSVNLETMDLNARLAFYVENTTGSYRADWAVDDIVIEENGDILGSYSFETGVEGWETNSSSISGPDPTDAFPSRIEITTGTTSRRFNRRSGGTGSSGTGPTSAADGSWYIYPESSSSSTIRNYWAFSPPLFPNKLTFSSIDVTEGGEEGGNTVALTGINFDIAEPTEVLFGNNYATNVTVVSDTEITCIAPEGAGTVDVLLIQGTSFLTLSEAYTYISPRLLNITFDHNFHGADIGEVSLFVIDDSDEQIGGAIWTYSGPSEDIWKTVSVDVDVLNRTGIRVVFNAVVGGTGGLADWAVTNVKVKELEGIISEYKFDNNFHGWQTSMTDTDILGNATLNTSHIITRTDPITNRFNRNSGDTPTPDTGPSVPPPNSTYYLYTESSSPNNVANLNFWAFSPLIGLDQYTVTSIDVTEGDEKGGSLVSISGEDFRNNAMVFFGGIPAKDVKVVNSNRIDCISPPGSGTVDVIVKQGPVSLNAPSSFTYLKSEKVLISFYHNYHGNNIKEVELYIMDDNASIIGGPLWRFSEPSEDEWKYVKLEVSISNLDNFRLGFKSVMFGDERADWAVDDVTISKNGEILFKFDFEEDNNNWRTSTTNTTSSTSAFSNSSLIETSTTFSTSRFRRNTGPTPTADTGPSAAIDGGHYIYTESSTTSNSIDQAFWAFSPLIGVGELNITKIDPHKSTEYENAPVKITGENFRNGATVQFGASYATNVRVIDSQNIECIAPTGSGSVGVTIEQGTDSFILEKGFEYVITEPVTVSFQHYYYGSQLNGVELRVIDEENNLIGGPVWSYDGPSEEMWKSVSISIGLPKKSKLVFNPVSVGTSGTGDWAFDALNIERGTDPVLYYDFESGPQDWQTNTINNSYFPDILDSLIYIPSSSNDVSRFNRITGATNSSSTGPTAAAEGSYYLYSESSPLWTNDPQYYWAISPLIGLGDDFIVYNPSPAVGPDAGGNIITFTGENFRNGLSITIGGVASSSINVISSNKLECVVPAGIVGLADIVITQEGVSKTIINGYEYAESVSLDISFQHHYYGSDLVEVNLYEIDADDGSVKGSPIWTYSGPSENAWKSASASFNIAPGSKIAFLVEESGGYRGDWGLDDINITDSSSGNSIAYYDFEADGNGWETSSSNSFDPIGDYANRVTVTDNTSDFNRQSGGTGSSSTGPSSAAQGTYYIYPETSSGGRFIWAFSPAFMSGGGGSGTMNILSVSPTADYPAGGNEATIIGSNFDTGLSASVTFAGNPATNVVVVSDTEITCTIPAGTLDQIVDVGVTQDGVSRYLVNSFRYAEPETVSISFKHVYYGYSSNLGTISLFLLNSNGEQVGGPIWTYDGPISSAWRSVDDLEIDIFDSGAYLAFHVANPNGGYRSDWAIDAVQIGDEFYGFESSSEGWTTGTLFSSTDPSEVFPNRVDIQTATYSKRFNRRSGSTPTSYTGPNSAYEGSFYIYAETGYSSTVDSNYWAFSPPIKISDPTPQTILATKTSTSVIGESGGIKVYIYGFNFIDTSTTVLFGANHATEVTVLDSTTISCIAPSGTGITDITVEQGVDQITTLTDAVEYAPSTQLTTSFNYHYNGNNIGDVSLFAINGSGNIVGGPFWIFSGPAADQWVSETVTIDIFDPLEENVRLALMVRNNSKEKSEWSIDSVIVSDGTSNIIDSDFENIFHGWETSTVDTKNSDLAFSSRIALPDSAHAGTARFLRTKPSLAGPSSASSGDYFIISGVGGENNLWLFSPVIYNST